MAGMEERKRRRSDKAGRPRMQSPGRPTVARREDRLRRDVVQRTPTSLHAGLPEPHCL